VAFAVVLAAEAVVVDVEIVGTVDIAVDVGAVDAAVVGEAVARRRSGCP